MPGYTEKSMMLFEIAHSSWRKASLRLERAKVAFSLGLLYQDGQHVSCKLYERMYDVCVYVYVYVYLYIYMHIYTHTYICRFVCEYGFLDEDP